jgi:hypothetical protein
MKIAVMNGTPQKGVIYHMERHCEVHKRAGKASPN